MGAIDITRTLAGKLEKRLGRSVLNAAIAIPPGTSSRDSGTHRHIVEAAGMEVTAVKDEPTAANSVLHLKDGVVVDIGGGTTGLAVFRDGKVIYVADEATGGIHMTLLLMRRYKLTYEQAEEFKQNTENHDEVYPAVLPVMEKMAGIVKKHLKPYSVDEVRLVGGTCSLTGIEEVFTDILGIEAKTLSHPMMVTPLGIALSCKPNR
jgi:ethanolamine utilization protein EutJ